MNTTKKYFLTFCTLTLALLSCGIIKSMINTLKCTSVFKSHEERDELLIQSKNLYVLYNSYMGNLNISKNTLGLFDLNSTLGLANFGQKALCSGIIYNSAKNESLKSCALKAVLLGGLSIGLDKWTNWLIKRQQTKFAQDSSVKEKVKQLDLLLKTNFFKTIIYTDEPPYILRDILVLEKALDFIPRLHKLEGRHDENSYIEEGKKEKKSLPEVLLNLRNNIDCHRNKAIKTYLGSTAFLFFSGGYIIETLEKGMHYLSLAKMKVQKRF